ncbi:MAG: sensor histidine kinase [Actinomycetota bacterium]
MQRLRELSAGVRVRTTAAAVLVVGAALVFASVYMVVKLRDSLTSGIHDAATLTAQSIATANESGTIGAVIETGDVEDEFVQLVDPVDGVVATTTNLSSGTPVVDLEPGENKTIEGLPFEDGPFYVVAVRAPTDEGMRRVIVGRTLEPVADSTKAVAEFVVVGIPALLIVVGVVTWIVVGRTLAPVEAIRNEVQTISGDQLGRRVPVPPANDEIAHLATTMNVMLDRLEEGRDRQRRLVSDASHELRSPIAAIRQHVEVAIAHPETIDGEELAEVVLAEDLRLQRMVEDLLLLTRIDEGTLALRRSQVDLDDIVLAEASRLRAASTNVQIDTRGVSAGRVIGDATHLDRLVRNLMDNAVRHADASVALSLHEIDHWVLFTVDDDGAGIPSRDRDRIFERFERVEEARDRNSGGTGLGLSIVREIVHAHHGTVAATDSPTGGARFEVRLPADPQG